jgi:hypothetical protein
MTTESPPPQVTATSATKPAAQTKPIVQTPTAGLDASAFSTLFQAVGAELKNYEKANGTAAAASLWNRYLRIRFTDAMTSQDKRDDATAVLAKVRADLAR